MQQTWLYRYFYIFSLPFTKASKQSEKRFSQKSLKLFFPKVFVLLPVVHFSNGSDRVDLCQRLFRRFFLENLQNYQSFQNIFGKIFLQLSTVFTWNLGLKSHFSGQKVIIKKITFDFNLPYVIVRLRLRLALIFTFIGSFFFQGNLSLPVFIYSDSKFICLMRRYTFKSKFQFPQVLVVPQVCFNFPFGQHCLSVVFGSQGM